jgi:hypothetical protein
MHCSYVTMQYNYEELGGNKTPKIIETLPIIRQEHIKGN